MADTSEAINNGAATVEQQAPATQSNAGTNQTQSTTGNSGSDDESNGAAQQDGENGSGRPSRVERKVGALHSELAEALSARQQVEEENARLKAMLEQPLGDRVKMPDYSNVDQVSPEQLKQDIINTADQIVKIRLEEGLRQNSQSLSQKQANDRVIDDIEYAVSKYDALNPNKDEAYNEDLEKYLVGSFQRAYKGDNTYRLKDHIDQYFANNTPSKQTTTDASTDRSRSAVRPNGQRTSTGGKSVDDMSADEYRAYIARR